MGIYAIRLIGRMLYEKYQIKHRSSNVTDTIVEVIMVMISLGIILFLIMSQETWIHKLLFLIGESYFLVYSSYIFKEIILKNKEVN
ncbi:hypothetical protein PPSQR21_002740 [Paenibacillus polymyxa SQR-21]|nr:hypothetical protein PPSQR21_002740 [Paenibacillus polymyxa SQR-21]